MGLEKLMKTLFYKYGQKMTVKEFRKTFFYKNSKKLDTMPPIALIRGGIIIYMNVFPAEHNPPHIHASYESTFVRFNFDGEYIGSGFPDEKIEKVREWMLSHFDELEANWLLAKDGEKPFRIYDC
jgi:hypothetical protein